MSAYTFLLTTDSSRKPPAGAAAESELLHAIHCIPVFWYMLFDEGSIVRARYDGDEVEEPTHYPALSKPARDALALARTRWPGVREVLGDLAERLFAQWVRHVETRDAGFFHCELRDWFADFGTYRDFAQELRTCIRGFDRPPARRNRRLVLNRWWDSLLDDCQVLDEGGVRPLGDFIYCGYGKGAPWSAKIWSAARGRPVALIQPS
jgi:hypothetical protein